MGFSIVFFLMPNMNDTISEQAGELLKLWLSILSRISFQRRKFEKKNPHQRFLKHGFKKKIKKDARRQSYYGIEIRIGQGNVKTQKLSFRGFSFVFCLLFFHEKQPPQTQTSLHGLRCHQSTGCKVALIRPCVCPTWEPAQEPSLL